KTTQCGELSRDLATPDPGRPYSAPGVSGTADIQPDQYQCDLARSTLLGQHGPVTGDVWCIVVCAVPDCCHCQPVWICTGKKKRRGVCAAGHRAAAPGRYFWHGIWLRMAGCWHGLCDVFLSR